MAGLLERIGGAGIDRRRFVELAAKAGAAGALAAGGVTGALGLTGCAPTQGNPGGAGGANSTYNADGTQRAAEADPPDLEGGEWVTAPCWMSCHTRCINKVYVVDGRPVRQKTDDEHPDTPDHPQQRGCLRGRATRQLILGADRLKYPLKRKSWQPGGGENSNASLRGRDEWERITWDEALDLTASEFKRIQETYGNLALCSPVLKALRVQGQYASVIFCAMGGCTTVWGQQSKGGWPLVGNTIKGSFGSESQDRFSLRKAKLIVLWGYNPIYSAGGSNTYYIRNAKDAGAKIIMVDPWFSPTAQGLADEWVPVRPGTDAALLAAIAYHMITNNLQDQDFLDTYTLGFDADHMPAGEEGQENFKDYILGAYDGQPKTPEWASEICGTAPDTIKNLAQQMATVKPMTLKSGQAPGRIYSGAQYAQMFYTVGWMTGNVGKSGAEVAACDGNSGVQGGSALVSLGGPIFKAPKNTVCSQPRGNSSLEKGVYSAEDYYGIAYAELWDAILTGKHTDFTRGTRDCNIKCICKFDIGAPMNQLVNASKMVEALRAPGKIEFNVTADFFMQTDALYSDIVFPAATMWEREGGYAEACNRETILAASKVIEPYFEAKPDWWIDLELARRLGLPESSVAPPYPEADYPTRVATATVINDAGEMEPLVTITEKDIEKWHLSIPPQEGRVTLDEVYARGGFQLERKEGDAYASSPLSSFVKDPSGKPLKSASGKLEIFSRALVDRMANFNTTPIAPIAKYVPSKEGYEAAFTNWNTKKKGDFRFQMISLHHGRQVHCAYNNVKSLNELMSDSALINSTDAAELGLKTNDTALIQSASGKALRRVQVSDRVMPGVVIIGQGGWTSIDDATGIDMGCNVNILTGSYLVGEGTSPYNTVLLKIQKWTGTPLEPDYLRPQRTVNI